MTKEERDIHRIICGAIRDAAKAHPQMKLRDSGESVSKRIRRAVVAYYQKRDQA